MGGYGGIGGGLGGGIGGSGMLVTDPKMGKEVLQDIEASYREMVVLLVRMVKTYAKLLPERAARCCEELNITNNPLARDKEAAANAIAKVCLMLTFPPRFPIRTKYKSKHKNTKFRSPRRCWILFAITRGPSRITPAYSSIAEALSPT